METIRVWRKYKTEAEKYWDECFKEDELERAALSHFKTLCAVWRMTCAKPQCDHLMGEFEGMMVTELKRWWGSRARLDLDWIEKTIKAADGNGYEKEF